MVTITCRHHQRVPTRLHDTRGAALVTALLSMTVLTILGMTALTTTTLQNEISVNYREAAQAFYTAEAGLSRAVGQLKDNSGWVASLPDPNDAFQGDNGLDNTTYVVRVIADDPNPGDIRIESSGSLTSGGATTAMVEAVVAPGVNMPVLDKATFVCGDILLNETSNHTIRDGDVYAGGNFTLKGTGTNRLINSNASATGNIEIESDSQIDGDVVANGNITVDATTSPNITGDATAGGTIDGLGPVAGTSTPGAGTPVVDECTGPNLANQAITAEDMQDLINEADHTLGAQSFTDETVTYTGIVHIPTGDLTLSGNVELSGDVTFIVENGNVTVTGSGGQVKSNPPGSTVTFLVPNGNFDVTNSGTVEIDGAVHVGTVNADGTNITGGNVKIENNADLTVNGSVITTNGNLDATLGGTYTVNYTAPTDSNFSGTFTIKYWRQVYSDGGGGGGDDDDDD